MSIPSRAEPAEAPAADAPYSHRGLTYPFGRRAPETGEAIVVTPGLRWARLPVPGSLKHVNVWLLDDGDGVAIVDAGLDIEPCREAWETILTERIAGRAVTRILVTHFHPDHVGLAGWLADRFSAPIWMTREEWLLARLLCADVRDMPPAEAVAFWRLAGWDEERVARETAKGWGRFAMIVSPMPAAYVRLREGDVVAIGDGRWRVVIGSGHCPEHACLIDDAGKVMIAGDQVLPKITSNVSLMISEPLGDPLGEWLGSIDKLRALPDDLLVLPSHGEPFTGLHARLDALEYGHRDRLDALHGFLATPRRAIDCFPLLFGRAIDDSSQGLATGEALAHLRHLEIAGRAAREVRDGIAWFGAL